VERALETFSPGYSFDLAHNNRVFGVNPDLGCYEKTYCIDPSSGSIAVAGNDTSFCQGSPLLVKLLAPGGGINYNWSNGATTDTTTVRAAGIYKVAVLNASGCRSFYQKTIVVTPLPVPVVAQNNGVFTTSVFATYQWMKGDQNIAGATAPTYTPNTSGTYKVKVVNADGCEGISLPITITINTTAVRELNGHQALGLYPNPVTDRAMIDVSALDGAVQSYSVFDIVGKRILQQNSVNVKSGTVEMLLPATIRNGTYILNLITDKGVYSAKFVVKR
jgi:hypothetical protein